MTEEHYKLLVAMLLDTITAQQHRIRELEANGQSSGTVAGQ